ncbi:unnamed protein product [Rotaria magnacalcarata]|uniref:SWIM-type domain-containing protein n=1 Tax=Rotaria magnacalcarata TaxID=392030 RepID=A0A820LY46_9BILA|nr:unnamed protein product [Rotaria magnacalcarata]
MGGRVFSRPLQEVVFFSERINQSFLLNLGTLSRIVAASLNRYRPIIYDTKSMEHEDMAQRMLSLLKQQSNIETLVTSGQLSLRKNWIKIFDVRENFNFPHLDLDFLRNYTCGTYQLKMSKPYAKAHLFENENEFELQMSPDNDQLIRCRLHSRHSGNTRYFICIEFDNNDEDEPIRDHFCQCKSGKRKIGCCAHVATILWYIRYARHIGWTPTTRTDQFKEKIMTC